MTITDIEKIYNEFQCTNVIVDHQTGNELTWLYEDDTGRVFGDSEDAMIGLVYLPFPFMEENAASKSQVIGFTEDKRRDITLIVKSVPLEFPTLEYEDEYTRVYYHRGKRWAAWNGDTYIRLIKQDMSLPELIEYLKD